MGEERARGHRQTDRQTDKREKGDTERERETKTERKRERDFDYINTVVGYL